MYWPQALRLYRYGFSMHRWHFKLLIFDRISEWQLSVLLFYEGVKILSAIFMWVLSKLLLCPLDMSRLSLPSSASIIIMHFRMRRAQNDRINKRMYWWRYQNLKAISNSVLMVKFLLDILNYYMELHKSINGST